MPSVQPEQASEDLLRAHEALVEALRRSTDVADQAVLATGGALSAIVGEAMAQIDDSARSMQSATEHGRALREALGASSKHLSGYLDAFDAKTGAMEREVCAAVEACRRIEGLVKEFDSAMLTCDALAIFMKIEVARLPAKDHHVGVLADELKALSLDLRSLAATVDSVSSGLLAELTGMSESARRSAGRRAEVSTKLDGSIAEIERLGAELQTVLEASTSDGPSNEIVRCSQLALSRLQYHDPLIQELQTLDALAAELRNDVHRALGSPASVAPIAWAARLGDGAGSGPDAEAPEAGELLLF